MECTTYHIRRSTAALQSTNESIEMTHNEVQELQVRLSNLELQRQELVSKRDNEDVTCMLRMSAPCKVS